VLTALQRSHRDVVQFREEVRIRRARRAAAAVQLRRRYQKFEQGRETIDFLLQAQRNWAEALREEYVAVSNYNVALADHERQKGTILDYRNVKVLEGPLPACARPRASECIRQSTCPATEAEPTTASPGQGPEGGASVAAPSGAPAADSEPSSQPTPISLLLDEQKELPDRLCPVVQESAPGQASPPPGP
jgi:hypothetical protein